MKYELTDRDRLESLLVAVPILLTAIAHLFDLVGAKSPNDLIIIGFIAAFVAIFKKQIATWFLNLTKERQEKVVLNAIRISYYFIAIMYVCTLMFVVYKRFIQ